LPLTSKKRKGAQTKKAKALARQAYDLQEDNLQSRLCDYVLLLK